ncbi:hypothetical protein BS50DRAFT_33829 [Corynespora cassiicola Philippines]|uniref:Uncharacterized protein n=1 Tax=Corynespora cassiicola Philippines TaxID=1448308 RepID=A0A2T2PBY4_CORCC|nr:hypothetical protein BS50DRAFT_33829 [Corynespora cassiicola Philippines]
MEGDPASQQLLLEFAAWESTPRPPKPQPPSHSAEVGAGLLNSVRIPKRGHDAVDPSSSPPSSPAPVTIAPSSSETAGGKNKLKKPTKFLPSQAGKRQRIDRESRHGDVYSVPESPEKRLQDGGFRLPETVNRKPLKVRQKNKTAIPDTQEDPLALPSSPPMFQDPRQEAITGVQPSGVGQPQLRSGKILQKEVGISDTARNKGPEAVVGNAPRPKATTRVHYDSQGPVLSKVVKPQQPQTEPNNSVAHNQRSRRSSPEVVIDTNRKTSQSLFSAKQREAARASRQTTQNHEHSVEPEPVDEIQPTHQPLVEAGPVDEVQSADSQQGDAPPVQHGRGKPKKSNIEPKIQGPEDASSMGIEPQNSVDKPHQHSSLQEVRQSPETTIDSLHVAIGDSEDGQEKSDEEGAEQESEGNDSQQDDHDDGIDQESEEDASRHNVEITGSDNDDTIAVNSDLTDLERVFSFIRKGKRKGKCKTKMGRNIVQECSHACERLEEEEDLSFDDVSTMAQGITKLLSASRASRDRQIQGEFKGDAYCHLFRALVKFLQAAHSWFKQNYDDPETVLEPVRFMQFFASEIHSFKVSLQSWPIDLEGRSYSSKPQRDVEDLLFRPLKEVNRHYDNMYRNIKHASDAARFREIMQREHQRREQHDVQFAEAREALRRGRQRREELELQRSEAAKKEVERYKRWQNLHIRRKQAGTDIPYRTWLDIMPLPDRAERDANGVRFERVAAFGERADAPPGEAPPNAREWSNRQTEALLDGLERFAGPSVFEWIFKECCGPRRPLREFRVADIVWKAETLRYEMIRLYRAKGWAIPEWLEGIPVL